MLVGTLELPLASAASGARFASTRPRASLFVCSGPRELPRSRRSTASVGLASNLAAVRALATDGIQRGHMALHARSVAIAAGAATSEVERIALMIVEARDITVDGAGRALRIARGGDVHRSPNRQDS